MNEAHNSLLSIHPGSTKMYHDLKQSYWWTRMKREIAQFVNECDVCRRVKAEHQRPAGLLQPLAIPEWKFDQIEMDFVTGFPKSKRGNDAIFVVIDKLSKVAHFLPIKESITTAQLAELYTSRIVSLYGISQLISSDRGIIFCHVLGLLPKGHGHQHLLQHGFPSSNKWPSQASQSNPRRHAQGLCHLFRYEV